MRFLVLGLAGLLSLALVGRADDAKPVQQSDLTKYVGADAKFFVHVNVPKLFASDMVRKIVPMAIEKYSDQIVAMAGMAKTFNPAAPEVPEDQLKDAIKKLTDPKVIAQGCDMAKDVVTDIMVAGSAEGDSPNVVVVVKCQFITAQMMEMMVQLAGANPQMKIEKLAKPKGSIYALTVPNADEKAYLTVPEPGLLHIAMSEAGAEASFAPAAKMNAKLAGLMAKRGANDFVFATGLGDDDDDYTTMAMSLTLDKDLGMKVLMSYKDEAKAKEEAKNMNEQLTEMLEQVKGFLGDRSGDLKSSIEKTKVTTDGKNVTATASIPGAAVEKLLNKE